MKYSVYYIFTIITFLLFPASLDAAQIVRSSDVECRVDILGPIERDDYAKLAALEEHLVINNGESSSASVVCLDSIGGNVTAGLAMAEFFLEKGVSTRIRRDAKCYSICAIMFMMGNYRGPEVAGLSRRMHVTAKLGFHRPYLSLQEAGSYTSGDIAASYEYGVASIFDILTLANLREPWGTAQMIEPDLMRRITGTPGDEIFLVSTVEEALRWNIEVVGIPTPRNIGAAQLFFACENALAVGHSLTTELAGDGLLSDEIFDLAPLNAYSIKQVKEGGRWDGKTGAYHISSLRSGYSSIGCEVVASDKWVMVCGFDEQTDTRVGDCGEPPRHRYFSTMALYHPASDLIALALSKGDTPEAVKVRHCRVFDVGGNLSDDESCLQEVALISAKTDQLARHIITWSSGASTVIEINAKGSKANPAYRINGEVATPVSFVKLADCITNNTSGNTFCLSD